MIGVSFPIYFLPQKSKVKQARLTATSAQIQADANIRELRNKTHELEASLRRYNESLRYYTSSALKEADELTKAANLQLQQSKQALPNIYSRLPPPERSAEAILKQSTNTILLHWNMNFSSRWKIETLNEIHHPE